MSWSSRWIDALSERAGLDATRLARGSTAAKQERVGQIEIEPGLLRAEVDGSTPNVVVIGIAPLSAARVTEVLAVVSGQASLSAALLAGEIPEELADLLLPARGEVSCDCSCPDGLEPCTHAAAVLHATAQRLDVEPFALFLLRGVGRNELLTELRARRAETLGVDTDTAPSDLPRGVDPGTSAAEAWRRSPEPVTVSMRPPWQHRGLPPLAAPPPSDSGIDEAELRALVDDAAERAKDLLNGVGDSALSLSTGADVVRRAARGDIEAISAATKLPLDELTAATQAWQFGGAAGLRVSRRKWEATEDQLAPGLAALGASARCRANRVSLQRSQLRLDEDGQWWLFTADDALGWVLASAPADDPHELV